ncbi:hypothetical protein RND81_06G115800 [Saponaria officinalis]
MESQANENPSIVHLDDEIHLDEVEEIENEDIINEDTDDVDVDNPDTEDDPFMPKSRKRASWWNDLIILDLPNGEKKAQCKYCNVKLSYRKGGPTTHLSRHINKNRQMRRIHERKQSKIIFLPIDSSGEGCGTIVLPPLHDGKFDMLKMREVAAHWILMHEHPFSILEEEGYNLMMKRARPEWTKISRNTGKSDCVKVYEQEKKKLKTLLR